LIVLIVGLVILLGTHSLSIVAPGWADRTSEKIGQNAWRSIYSIASLTGLVLTIYGYGIARAELVIWYVPPLWLRYVAVVLMLFVFPLLLAAFFPGRIKAAVKHPMLVGTKTWATAHLLANGARADVLLFGLFLAWAVADRISLKNRPQRPLPEKKPSPQNDLIAVVVGLGLFAAFVMGVHAWAFGVPVPGPWN
jgi:uncharacterized membrane protein